MSLDAPARPLVLDAHAQRLLVAACARCQLPSVSNRTHRLGRELPADLRLTSPHVG